MDDMKLSAYRAFRAVAYRRKYETALVFCGKRFRYGDLLARSEYAYNTFRQMRLEPGERVALWLPDCPDLLTCFYALSRLGALAVLIHPKAAPREVRRQMAAVGAERLITDYSRYSRYCREEKPFAPGKLLLCRIGRDMKGHAAHRYPEVEQSVPEEYLEYCLDRLTAENRYNAQETPFGDEEQPAVILFGTSGFLQVRPISYLPAELAEKAEGFRRPVKSVYIGASFATEGGFLAAHSALCAGQRVVWSYGEPFELLKKEKPELLIATEEFFWELRQRAGTWGTKWEALRGGIQLGKPLTPLMEKFAARAFAAMGGKGALTAAPVPLKVEEEALCFIEDFGVRPGDMEQLIEGLPGVARCRVGLENSVLQIRVQPVEEGAGKALGKEILALIRREMNPLHLPRSLEFCTYL